MTYEIRSEQRDSHWVAWVTREGNPKPHRSVLLVAASQAEAEQRAREWADRLSD